jgi:7-cyano-7-deazaguanine synthase in queuosine biosynthesis
MYFAGIPRQVCGGVGSAAEIGKLLPVVVYTGTNTFYNVGNNGAKTAVRCGVCAENDERDMGWDGANDRYGINSYGALAVDVRAV